MTWNNTFLNDVGATPLPVSGTLGAVLLHQALGPADGSIDDLLDQDGIQEVYGYGYTPGGLAPPADYAATVDGTTGVTTIRSIGNFEFDNTNPVYVEAVAFYYVGTVGGVTNPWIYILEVNDVWYPGTILSSPREPDGDVDTRLFSYLTATPVAGPAWFATLIQFGPMDWAPSRVTKIYLYPQRINWIPNPTFFGSLFGWRANAVMTREVEGDLSFLRTDAGGEIQSLLVPIPNGMTTVALKVRSQGATTFQAKVTMYDEDGQRSQVLSSVVALPESPVGQASWISLRQYIPVADRAARSALSFLVDGPIDIDDVLWSTGYADFDYFDGDSLHSFPDDFLWHSTSHASYSFFYNNRGVAHERMFGENGLIKQWIPEGARYEVIYDHLDPKDTNHPVKDWEDPILAPPPPMSLAVVPGSITTDTATWTWEIPPDTVYDSLWVSIDGGTTVELPPDTVEYTTMTLTPGADHTIEVWGVVGIGESDHATDTITTLVDPDSYFTVVMADNPLSYWTLGAKTYVAPADYFTLIRTEGLPIDYWPLGSKDPVTYPSYAASVLSDTPLSYWKLDDMGSPHTYFNTGAMQYFTVPAGVTSITVEMAGGASGAGADPSAGNGPRGAYMKASFPVTPLEVLQVQVGGCGVGHGRSAPTPGWPDGGYGGRDPNPGGTGAAGGASSDIRRAPYSLNDRLLVAAGGGSPGATGAGGIGGVTVGQDGTGTGGVGGGTGGTQTAAGTGGNGDAAFGQGGSGHTDSGTRWGGGGGGGWWGGGGGNSAVGVGSSGGGGGSSFVHASGTLITGTDGGGPAGTGTYVIISWTAP